MMEALGDQALVPARAILIFEQDQIPGFVDARGKARGLKRHHGYQRVHAGSCDGRSRQQTPQAQGFEAQVAANQVLAFMRGVAFVKDEVDGFERGVEPLIEIRCARQVERDTAARGAGAWRAPDAVRWRHHPPGTHWQFRAR